MSIFTNATKTTQTGIRVIDVVIMIINSAREPITPSPTPIQPSVKNIPPPFNLYGKALDAG